MNSDYEERMRSLLDGQRKQAVEISKADRIADAIDDHLEWAYKYNGGKVDSEQLAKTIIQVLPKE